MLLTSLDQRTGKSFHRRQAAEPRETRWKATLVVAATMLFALPAFSGPASAQHGMGGGFGAMMGPPQYYQPPPPYQGSYQPPPYQPQYQQQQSDRYLQDEETQQMGQANAVAPHAAKRKVHTAPSATTAANGVITVKMKKTGGTFEVPVRINGALALDFTVDSGAADVMIPANVVSALIKSGTLKQEDYIGGQTFTLADGSKLPSVRFKLARLQIGDQTLTDVVASVAPAAGSALLGQSFLSRFASWTLNNTKGTLNLTMRTANMQQAAAAASGVTATDAAPAATAPATAAAAQSPDAPKPAPADSAPDNVAAASVMPEPSPDVGAHAAFVLPTFPDRTTYVDARSHLIALGYEPQETHPCAPNDNACFPERVSCFGSDVIQCKFEWKHGDRAILVQTVNYPPTVTKVECEKNCQ